MSQFPQYVHQSGVLNINVKKIAVEKRKNNRVIDEWLRSAVLKLVQGYQSDLYYEPAN